MGKRPRRAEKEAKKSCKAVEKEATGEIPFPQVLFFLLSVSCASLTDTCASLHVLSLFLSFSFSLSLFALSLSLSLCFFLSFLSFFLSVFLTAPSSSLLLLLIGKVAVENIPYPKLEKATPTGPRKCDHGVRRDIEEKKREGKK